MRKVFLSMCLLASITLSVAAQQVKGGKKGSRIEEVKDLDLSDSQKAAIKELKDAYREESKQRAEAHQDAIKAVLTPDQQAKWDKKVSRKKDNRPKRMDRRAAQTVRYDDEPAAKIQSLNEDLQKEIKAISMSRLTPEQQQRRIKEVNEKYSALRYEAVTSIEVIKIEPVQKTTDPVAVNPIAPMITFDAITVSKLETLDTEFAKQRKSIELSRIAPEMQHQKLEILEENYSKTVEKVLASDANVLESGREVFGTTLKLNAVTVKKLRSLNDEYLQAEKAIRMTRIAPEMQEKRIKDLNTLYADKRIAIVEAGIK